MKINHFLAKTAVAVVLATSGAVNAQVLGGGVNGGLGGSLTGGLGQGGLGNIGATGGGAVHGTLGASTDAIGRAREVGTRVKDKAVDTAATAREHAQSTAAGAQATASGAIDATVDTAADAGNALSATADAAGEAGSQAELSSDGMSGDAASNVAGSGSGMLDLGARETNGVQPAVSEPEPRQSKRERRAQQSKDTAPAEQPRRKVQADGRADANGGLSASGEGQASANADASAEAGASVRK